MKLGVDAIRDHARGRWVTEIFPALNIDVPANPRKHGPCPACGGKDRFRCDDRDGRGSWFCNQCVPNAGDGFQLVQRVRGCNFREALSLVAGILGLESSVRPNHRRPVPRPKKVNRVALAFRYELAALDLKLRSERVLTSSTHFDISPLSNVQISRLMDVVANAYHDVERAQMFEQVADGLREKDFHERQDRHAA